jgi:putative heme iron utilization protein
MAQRDTAGSMRGARRLWTGSFRGVLSTHSVVEAGFPFGSLVPYALDAEGLPVLLLSHLAQHTRNLHEDPRCAFTLFEPSDGDLQQIDRLTCLGECTPMPPEDAHAMYRYFRYFPAGKTYFKQLNFRFFRLLPLRFHFNGGFATARWVGTERILRTSPFRLQDELELIDEIESQHSSLLDERLPPKSLEDEAVRLVGVDPGGLDVRRGQRLGRIHFDQPLDRPEDIYAHLKGAC